MTSHSMSPYYFLASPYNGSLEEKEYRYQQSQAIVAYFLKHRISVFAPILYNEIIIKSFDSINIEMRRELLMPMNLNFLYRSAGVIIFKTDGWNKSWGMKQYLETCSKNDLPIYELYPGQMEKTFQTISAAMNS